VAAKDKVNTLNCAKTVLFSNKTCPLPSYSDRQIKIQSWTHGALPPRGTIESITYALTFPAFGYNWLQN
jgi:hypothetical protein